MDIENIRSESKRVREFHEKYGNLEQVRSSLNLSKREISDLLWVEPSAWTRWSLGTSRPPEHIYRALGWYLELREKNQEMPAFKAEPSASVNHLDESIAQVQSFSQEWQDEKRRLQKEIDKKEALGFGWKLILIVCLVISVFNLIF